MKRRWMMWAGLFPMLVLTGNCWADSAEVLPKGVWSVTANLKQYLRITQKYDEDGHVVDAAQDFNTTINSNIIEGLALLENNPLLPGLGTGEANIGTTEVTFKYNIAEASVLLARGLTDKLTVGVRVPFMWQENKVTASLNADNATVGLNPLYGLPCGTGPGQNPFCLPDGTPIPLIPVIFGGQKMTTEDMQQVLGGGLSINGVPAVPGFGYKRFETWSDQGFGDIEAGAKYKYYESDNWRLAGTLGLRFPTGEVDDPDNLVDRPFGSGAWTIVGRSHNDYIGVKNLVLNATIAYELTLPDTHTLRITEDANHPISDQKASVHRNQGDQIGLEAGATYEFFKGFFVSGTYQYDHAFKDSVPSYPTLEDQTDWTSQVFLGTLSYSTVPLYVEKKFSLPMVVSLTYRNRFAGTNSLLKSEYINLGLQFYF